MIGIYERVSSVSQDFDAQHRDLEQWATGKEARFFTDKFTGTTMERPGWEKLWRQCCAGKIDTIAVWRLDRLGRTARGLITLRDELRQRKINLVSLRDTIDLSTPSGRLMFDVIASIAEYETEIRRERQLAGIATAKARGTYKGMPKGTLHNRTRALLPVIYKMADAGLSQVQIAKATKTARHTVRAILKQRGSEWRRN